MALIIPHDELARLHAHAREGYPHEVVGILAGERGAGRVIRVVPLVNERADSPRNRYQVSGLVLLRAEERLQSEGLEVVGYYHSHPDHPARWSDFDREHALPNMSYVITSVMAGEIADTRSWRLREDRSAMDEEPLSSQESPMSVCIHIPTALRSYTNGQASVEVQARNAGEALESLTGTYPALARHLRTEDGKLRSFVNVYLNDEDIRFLDKEQTALKEGDTLTIVPSIAGGA